MFIAMPRGLVCWLSIAALAVLLAGCPVGTHSGPMQHGPMQHGPMHSSDNLEPPAPDAGRSYQRQPIPARIPACCDPSRTKLQFRARSPDGADAAGATSREMR